MVVAAPSVGLSGRRNEARALRRREEGAEAVFHHRARQVAEDEDEAVSAVVARPALAARSRRNQSAVPRDAPLSLRFRPCANADCGCGAGAISRRGFADG